MTLVAEKIAAGYGHHPVIRNIDLEAGEGELLVLAGPNGSGKTTLLKTLAGFLPPRSGRVLIDNQNIFAMNNRERAALRAFLFQESGPRWPFTVEELVSQGSFRRGKNPTRAETKNALSSCGLEGFETRPVTELSGGEYQRVLLARALVQEVPFLLMDEPVNNLDPKYQIMLMELLQDLCRRGLSAIVSLHDLNLAALYAHRIALISGGEITALGPPALTLREDILKKVFDAPISVGVHPNAPGVPLVYT
ncbi:hemin import ATP-binding protein HmuV [Spirochaetia bacterium]|nr:hemin import ATP-binding protein HmuV [Spirochaetia bacterium]